MKDSIFTCLTVLENKKNITNIVAKNIGKKIKLLRSEYRLSGSDLARIIGISQQQLSRYENGLSDISTSKIMLISVYFKVDVCYFFKKD
ncbi:helix-turn-helix domain-containing protein [Providencia hangzhouensis]|uniref:Helix-turn-helix domain-containing protein n=1 Tax=Providencia rettgeri TaxID=587 RepID=A0AAE2ZCK1_PRORE|nr:MULTISPECIES: helix-turn-helix transcriptional regulator [Providencia]MRF68563.1 helix-turn-helix domain-containing protein [Escherichia coli]EFE54291.1 DNA-binding helix-turn-helix protein [Providencia rettgeri DSM 1131]MBG5893046.1 helix-turn-helix transcriptional regulator [Providencia rettgeri]MBI6190429.1 helix-turn-helix transcriptional regulator [Providencia rettgeri]MBQ0531132.1 helix-turn-helix transcriptional regulator [Providencia rettgeri]